MISSNKKVVSVVGILIFLALLHSSSFGRRKEFTPPMVGDPFPLFSLPNTFSPSENRTLGLPQQETISLQDFPSEILLIELLNVYCHTCQLQVPAFNQLWESIQTNKTLKSKVALLGITAGNNVQEVEKFRRSFEVKYPILADPNRVVYNSLGIMRGTPHTFLLRRDPLGKWYIIYHHRGPVDSFQTYLKKIEECFSNELEGVEPGYKIPQKLITTLKKLYPHQSFEQEKLIIYFPPYKRFPLEDDIRNKDVQMKVLLSLLNEEDLIIVIIGFLDRLFPPLEMEMLKKTPHLFLLNDNRGFYASQFHMGENPILCLVNDSGRIVFRTEALTSGKIKELLGNEIPKLTSGLSEREIQMLIFQSMKAIVNTIERVEIEELPNGELLYLGYAPGENDEALLFGRTVSQYSICDVCHDIHYYYLLDQNGIIVNFEPIHITKIGNVPWEQQDLEKMRSRIVGKDAFKEIPFDPQVDAVSQATMSSYLVFEGLNETRDLLGSFKDHGFRKGYFRELCLRNLCEIKRALIQIKKKGPTDKYTLDDNTSLDVEKVKASSPSSTFSQCPLEGKYLLIGDIPICSFHGMNLEPCPSETIAEP